MSRLANLGHEVIFVDPPIRVKKLVKQVLQGKWSLRRLLTGSRVVKTGFGENAELINFSPVTLSYSEDPNLTQFNTQRFVGVTHASPWTRHASPLQGNEIKTVLWVYNPSMREYIEQIPHDLLVYDCVDNYPAMANYQRLRLSEMVNEWEESIAKTSDLVFATTPGLVEKLKKINPETYFVPNAGSYEIFSKADRKIVTMPKALEGLESPIVGFTGTIDNYKVNSELIKRAVESYPNFSFVIVGPSGEADKAPDVASLKLLPNVHFLPEVAYKDQLPYYTYFDEFIIPYRLNDYTVKGCFPIKFIDALAAGLPTVVTNLPSYENYQAVCSIGKDDAEFVRMIGRAILEDSPERRRARQKVAAENSWDGKVSKQLEFINKIINIKAP